LSEKISNEHFEIKEKLELTDEETSRQITNTETKANKKAEKVHLSKDIR